MCSSLWYMHLPYDFLPLQICTSHIEMTIHSGILSSILSPFLSKIDKWVEKKEGKKRRYKQGTHGVKCVKHVTNDQNMINMHNHGNPQKLVLIRVQNNEKMSFGHFIKYLECTHYTCKLNNAWTYENLV